ncbi:MAG: MFS transporter [Bacteroidales bacterium]|nr:MFS transporter [Bacteroidales bacterium]MBQ6577649.1 MFS transporter [Bacteroidales bacterium]
MSLFSYFRISKPSEYKVPEAEVDSTFKRLRSRTFWGATVAYSLYYVCRMALSVVKQPLIDDGLLSAGQLGIIGSAMLFVYAVGKFVNGFIADYCNVRRFMFIGLLVSALVNLVLGVTGLLGGAFGISSMALFLIFALLWGVNGWSQSMGSPPGVIGLSRWYPLKMRGTFYSIFSATPYLGKFLSFVTTGLVVGWIGWEYGFIFSAVAGLIGAAVILIFVSDTPQSKGLPSVQEYAGETLTKADTLPTKELQKFVVKNPGIWVIAFSSAFIYITQYAVSGWGVLFLQKAKTFSLESATQIIAFAESFGIAGTVLAGWLSDRLFKGDRVKPVIISGLLCFLSLGMFLLSGGGYIMNIVYVSVFSLAIGVLFCIVAGLMALDIIPRKATGSAMGIVGISSYIAAGIQDIVSGYLIQGNETGGEYNFVPVAIFWLVSCFISFALPVFNWRHMKKKVIDI